MIVRSSAAALLALGLATAARAQTDAVTVVKAGNASAVVRVGSEPARKVKVGDAIGTTKAVIREIAAGRVVLEETFTAADGRPNRALVIIKEGERGGTRYLQRSEEPPLVGIRSTAQAPSPAPKKPIPPKKP